MKVGGTRRLLIPAAMAYGSNPPYGSGIPADADLVFDIELVSIDG
jgi:FKBP-type peptidyl-prolyl cis-trans isomerase FkpA